jgi:hypothetical protein
MNIYRGVRAERDFSTVTSDVLSSHSRGLCGDAMALLGFSLKSAQRCGFALHGRRFFDTGGASGGFFSGLMLRSKRGKDEWVIVDMLIDWHVFFLYCSAKRNN